MTSGTTVGPTAQPLCASVAFSATCGSSEYPAPWGTVRIRVQDPVGTKCSAQSLAHSRPSRNGSCCCENLAPQGSQERRGSLEGCPAPNSAAEPPWVSCTIKGCTVTFPFHIQWGHSVPSRPALPCELGQDPNLSGP